MVVDVEGGLVVVEELVVPPLLQEARTVSPRTARTMCALVIRAPFASDRTVYLWRPLPLFGLRSPSQGGASVGAVQCAFSRALQQRRVDEDGGPLHGGERSRHR